MLPLTFDNKLWNVISLGLCFMILFTADYTVTNMQVSWDISIIIVMGVSLSFRLG